MITRQVLQCPHLQALRDLFKALKPVVDDKDLMSIEIALNTADDGCTPEVMSTYSSPGTDEKIFILKHGITERDDDGSSLAEDIKELLINYSREPFPINVSRAEANDLKVLFLILAEEVLKDQAFKEAIIPVDILNGLEDASKLLYQISNYFDDISDQKHSH